MDLYGIELRHSIASVDTVDSWQSQRQCYKVQSRNDRLYCLPVGTLRVATGQIVFDGSFNSNEEAYTIVSRFSDKDIDRPFLESLFEQGNFQSFSGVTRFSAIYGETTFALVPYHFAGAFRISNPSLPSVSLATVMSSHLMVSHNFVLDNIGTYSALIAPTFIIGSKETKSGDFDALELAARERGDVIKSEKWTDRSGGVSFALLSRRAFLPSLSVRFDNITASEKCKACREGTITIDSEISPYASANLGFYAPMKLGLLWTGVGAKYGGVEPTFDSKSSNVLLLYRLGFLDSFVSLAPSIVSFGFNFDSNLYRVGIQYTDEKQNNELQIARKKHSYIHLGFKI